MKYALHFTGQAEDAEKDKCKTSAISASSAVKNLMGEIEKILTINWLKTILFSPPSVRSVVPSRINQNSICAPASFAWFSNISHSFPSV